MAAARNLFLVGSSQLTYSESRSAPTIAAATVEALSRLTGEPWAGQAELAYPLPGMAGRVRGFVERYEPDAIVLFLGSSVFAEEKMEFALQKRSKLLYRLVRPIVSNLKQAAGGGTEGEAGPRGLIFRAPRWAGRKVIGTAPLVDADVAWCEVRESITLLVGWGPLLVIKSTGTAHDAATRARSEARVAEFNARTGQHCEALGLRCLDMASELRARGGEFRYTADGGHPARGTREASAEVIAEALLDVLAGRGVGTRTTSPA
jgi:hypothetical protein